MPFRDPVFTRIFCTGFLAGLVVMTLVLAALLKTIVERCVAH